MVDEPITWEFSGRPELVYSDGVALSQPAVMDPEDNPFNRLDLRILRVMLEESLLKVNLAISFLGEESGNAKG